MLGFHRITQPSLAQTSMNSLRRAKCLLLVVPVLSSAVSGVWAQSYTAINLGSLGGSFTFAYGINSQGTVVGLSQTLNGSVDPFSYNGTMTDLGTLGGTNSRALDHRKFGFARRFGEPRLQLQPRHNDGSRNARRLWLQQLCLWNQQLRQHRWF